jgi:hypothetical protein
MTPLERFVLTSLADCLPEYERTALTADIELARVCRRAADGASVLFDIEGYKRPPYEGQRPYSVEASVKDADGKEIWIIAFTDQNGRLLELEFIRWEAGNIINPDLNSFRCRNFQDIHTDQRT